MAKLGVKWTKLAIEDLESAREYTAREHPQLLESTIDNILNAVDQIAVFPEIGRPGRVRGTREFVLGKIPFTVVYRQSLSAIEILSVLHQSRKWT